MSDSSGADASWANSSGAIPSIVSFTGASGDGAQRADSLEVEAGQQVVLSWQVAGADTITIAGGELGDSPAPQSASAGSGEVVVSPASSTQDYTLVASGGGISSMAQTVHVSTHASGAVVSAHAVVHSIFQRITSDWDMMHGKIPASPALSRPLVMIPGLTMKASSYDPMAKAFARTSGNGKVHVYACASRTFHDGSLKGHRSGDLSSELLFELEYIDARGAPSVKAPQLAKAFADIAGKTGASIFDVVCHSAGCTDFRLYLSTRSDDDAAAIQIGQVFFIGPASHGTEMGNLGKTFGGIAGLNKAGAELAVGSTLVAQLNDSWDAQLSQMDSCTILAVTGAPTMGPGGLSDGDGFMPVSQCELEGAELVTLDGLDPTAIAHLKEVGYSGVIAAIQERLGG